VKKGKGRLESPHFEAKNSLFKTKRPLTLERGEMMRYKIGVDVGGTFTDFLLVDEGGNTEVYKVPSTPRDPAIGVMNGLNEMVESKSTKLADFLPNVTTIVHGTTVTTNAVLTGSYAKTGFITVKGFRDYLNERRGMKRNIYTPKESPPTPIVPRYLIQCVDGRIDCEGNEFIPLNEDDVYKAIEVFEKENVEAIAVSLFFSFVNPAHELRVKEIIEKEMPDVYVSVSHEVLPQVRIYERASTTVFNASVGPLLRSYIASLTGKLRENGFKGTLLIMQSNGGVMSPEVAIDHAVSTLLSGPAGGPEAALFYGEVHGLRNIITGDMGGTSFDACLIRDGKPEITTENEVGEYRIAVPSLAVHSIGAGGGSVAWVDPRGILQIGPESAGATPGPACYGLGGTKPTVTDADLALGYLNADYFLGGKMKIYPDKAEKAIKEKVADPLDLSILEAAQGIYTVVNLNMAQGIRTASISKGYDPRACVLVIAGGAGPVHACDIAKELGMQLILIPQVSSIFCATGMLISNLRHDYVRSYYALIKEGFVKVENINSLLKEMEEEGRVTLENERVPPDKVTFIYSGELRYEAQLNEIEVPIPLANGCFSMNELPQLQRGFNKRHDELYGYSLPDSDLEVVSLRVKAEGITEKPRFKEMPYMGKDASSAVKTIRKIYYNKDFLRVPIYDGSMVGHGNVVPGTAILEMPTTTIFVTPDFDLTCDNYGNYLLHPKGINLDKVINKLKT